jgi:hypothetical protein
MPTGETYTRNLGPLVRAEMARLRAKGCTKSEINLYDLAYSRVTRLRR